MRCAYFDIVAPKPLPVERRRLFQSGRLVERHWIDVLRGLPEARVLSVQLPVHYQAGSFRVHGRIDALVQHEREPVVVHEVKSVGSLRYVVEPVSGHLEQLQFYLGVLGVENGRLDYVERSMLSTETGEKVDVSFPTKRDTKTFTGLLEKAEIFHEYLVQGETPPRETCWLCRHCLHKDACA